MLYPVKTVFEYHTYLDTMDRLNEESLAVSG